MKVALIACSKIKVKKACKAKELYSKSVLFRKRLAYAEKHTDKVLILSSKYYVVDPNLTIPFYNETLATKTVYQRRAWAKVAFIQLQGDLEGCNEILFLAGADYRRILEKYLKQSGIKVTNPVEGLGIGKQLQFFTENI